jgi:TolB-like protein/tetratricopeptide (TPR) repeat protein
MPESDVSANALTDGSPAPAGTPDPIATSDVFVSYASQDASIANAVVTALERQGVRCWIAPRDVAPGSLYADEIIRAINGTKILVLVLSRSAIASPHIGREVERASSKRRRIVTLRTDASQLTTALEYFLSDSQWIDLENDGTESAFAKLVTAARRFQAPVSASLERAPSGQSYLDYPPASTRKSWLLVAALLTVSVALGWFVVDKWSSRRVDARDNAAATLRFANPSLALPSSAPVAFNPPLHSIAVLPFTNLSGDPKQEYFSDGISEELINALSHVNALQVIARTSSFSFKGQNADIGTIARKLNVKAILEGSIRRSGGTVRITVQLIDAENGYHMWSQDYDRDLKNILALQTEIATSVAEQLRVRLLGNEAARIEVGGTQNPNAYDAFLRGMQLAEAGTGDEGAHRASLAAFDQAIALDPNYAAAYGRRAVALMDTRATSYDSTIRDDLRDQARNAAERAVLLAPERADAHTALWFVLAQGYFDFPGAALEIQRALLLSPGSEKTQQALALHSSWLGHHDLAIEAGRQAVKLDPQNYEARVILVGILNHAQRFDEALVAAQEAKAINPEAKNIRSWFAISFLGLKQLDLARQTCEQQPPIHWCLALVYHAIGNPKAADSEVQQLLAISGDSDAFRYAEIYAQWGDTAKALQWLRTAEKLSDPSLPNLKTAWLLDPIRNAPEFRALEARMNYPP